MSKLPRAKKHLGQHFLKDQNVITKITKDWCEECDIIIEVGPGPGVLTKKLAAIGKPLYLIEKDESMQDFLLEHVPENSNIFFQDALKFNWPKFLSDNELLDKKIWLVSNLPYNVGTVLFTQFMKVKEIQLDRKSVV